MRTAYILPTLATLTATISALPAPSAGATATLDATTAVNADVAAQVQAAMESAAADLALKIKADASANVNVARRGDQHQHNGAHAVADPNTRLTDLKGVAVADDKQGTEKVKAALGTKAQVKDGVLDLNAIAGTGASSLANQDDGSKSVASKRGAGASTQPQLVTVGAALNASVSAFLNKFAAELGVDLNVAASA
ncbi:uncharacterized protein BKCO1_8700027 [Diplodia corticola]|uniref:Uncharacterized protein n=1 Tax=Diplodia corticola TaxID=236234 RepID=A0A1J9QMF1_9PEZI|nr:uncharacterized protein BKCO1_8700027 [Diplodia corticola]OJD29242.1 hypothetical protein BKCO1_8700027 [Diplodia corticola]